MRMYPRMLSLLVSVWDTARSSGFDMMRGTVSCVSTGSRIFGRYACRFIGDLGRCPCDDTSSVAESTAKSVNRCSCKVFTKRPNSFISRLAMHCSNFASLLPRTQRYLIAYVLLQALSIFSWIKSSTELKSNLFVSKLFPDTVSSFSLYTAAGNFIQELPRRLKCWEKLGQCFYWCQEIMQHCWHFVVSITACSFVIWLAFGSDAGSCEYQQ